MPLTNNKFTITTEKRHSTYIRQDRKTPVTPSASTQPGLRAFKSLQHYLSDGKEVINFHLRSRVTIFYSLSRPVKRIKPTDVMFDAYPQGMP